ncbi:MAG: Lpg1974 family pore-forming outer membrane protein [Rhabdochlamydiaceae bacterium]
MFKKTSKLVVPFALLALGNVSSAFADTDGCKPCCTPTCCPPIKEECYNVCPPTNEITPKAGPGVVGGSDLYISADFIFWGVQQDGLEYAVVPSNATRADKKGEIYQHGTNWNPGFKLGLGGSLGHDGWDIKADYTWYETRHEGNHRNSRVEGETDETPSYTTAQINDSYIFAASPNGAVNSYKKAKSGWSLDLNVVNLEIGRNMYLSPRLEFRPHFGLKAAWQNQHHDLLFTTDKTGAQPNTTLNVLAKSAASVKSAGVGPRAGFDTAWHFNRHFSIVGDFSLTGLAQDFRKHRKDISVNFGNATDNADLLVAHVHDKTYSLKPILEWSLGLRYEFWTCGDDYRFAFEANWEAQSWLGQNQFIRFPGSALAGSDLNLHGLTFSTRFDF